MSDMFVGVERVNDFLRAQGIEVADIPLILQDKLVQL
jgi:hypothetical protein